MDGVLAYAVAELVLSVHIALSNLLVLWVYIRWKHVRTVTNSYIFSLALTDFLSGALGIPVTVISVLTRSPNSFYGCLFVHLILCILCTISTFHMLAIALDKYVTICCKDQLFSSRHSRAVALIASSWVAGTVIACLPLMNAFGFADRGETNFNRTRMEMETGVGECRFTDVVVGDYLVYVIFFATIAAPTLLIVYCYVSIYRRIRKEEKQVQCLLRKAEREKRLAGRRRLIKTLLILVVSYGICWYPLYIINTIDHFWPEISIADYTLLTVVLSHISCALNPLIYAYGMPGFKKALREFFNVHAPNTNTCAGYSCYIRSTTERKTRTLSARSHPQLSHHSLKNRKISAPCQGPLKGTVQYHHHHHHHFTKNSHSRRQTLNTIAAIKEEK